MCPQCVPNASPSVPNASPIPSQCVPNASPMSSQCVPKASLMRPQCVSNASPKSPQSVPKASSKQQQKKVELKSAATLKAAAPKNRFEKMAALFRNKKCRFYGLQSAFFLRYFSHHFCGPLLRLLSNLAEATRGMNINKNVNKTVNKNLLVSIRIHGYICQSIHDWSGVSLLEFGNTVVTGHFHTEAFL